MRMEKELYGDATDPSKQHTGINFEKYDDIPVEATGAGVPEPVLSFTSPPLDPVLLENIGYAMYTTPTPVQKYSIPIVAGGRDLMACAQVSSNFQSAIESHSILSSTLLTHSPDRLVRERLVVSSFLSYPRPSPKGLVPLLSKRPVDMAAHAKLSPQRSF